MEQAETREQGKLGGKRERERTREGDRARNQDGRNDGARRIKKREMELLEVERKS